MGPKVAAILLRLTRFPFLYVAGVGAYVVAASGKFGTSYGVHNLFLEDAGAQYGIDFFRNRPTFNTQMALSLAVMFAWFAPAFAEGAFDEGSLSDKIKRWAMFDLPIVVVVNIAISAWLLHAQLSVIDADAVRSLQIWYSILGLVVWIAVTIALVALTLVVSHYCGIRPVWTFLLFYGAILTVALIFPKLIPAVSIYVLLSLIAVAYLVIKLIPSYLRLPATALILAALVVGYNLSKKSQFPGIAKASGVSYYATPVSLTEQASADALPGSVDPVAALDAWRTSVGGQLPKLVIVATSGGAYRASFWASIVLDQIIEQSASNGRIPGLDRNIRLLTGASGGMVASAYFAATKGIGAEPPKGDLTQRLMADIKASNGELTAYALPRDSLSAIAQQLIQRDFVASFIPPMGRSDRGEVLEASWQTLAVSFETLARDEKTGLRPSLIFSPVLVETGAPILISNLDLRGIVGSGTGQLEFFRLFPETRPSFALRTAVRMSATFPYVSPIVELPTRPARRVVDAGYYDNYGVTTAIAYLRSPAVMKWLKDNVAGVMVVQIRATARDRADAPHRREASRCQSRTEVEAASGAFGWLSGPVEAATAAREVSMGVRNDQELGLLIELYGRDFVQTVAFENAARGSASWYVPQAEFDCFLNEAKSDYNRAAFERLETWWKASRL